MPGSIQSLDTLSISSDGSYDSDDEDRLAEQEWQESIQQLQQLFAIVLLPYLGKFLGRRWSHWGMCNILSMTPFNRSSDRITSLCPIRALWFRKDILSGRPRSMTSRGRTRSREAFTRPTFTRRSA